MADKNTEQSQTDLSFLDDKQSVTFRIKDIVFLLLRNVHWLLLFAIVGAVIANFYARRQEKTYASHAKILIRSGNELGISDDDTREATLRTSLGLRSFYSSTINNEIMILTSKTTVRKVVEELNLNMSYSTKTRFIHRDKELYRSSPIEIVTADRDEGFTLPGKMTVTIINKNYALLHSAGHHSLYIPFDKTVITPMGRLSIRKTWAFEEDYIGQDIIVHNRPVESVADYYRGKLVVERDSEKNTILNLSMRDGSAQRCADFINALIRVYNDGAVNDKKRIISDTYNYINERINIISGDLDAQESAMANYRSSNDVVTSASVGESYIHTSLQSDQEAKRLQAELEMVRMLLAAVRSNDGSRIIPIGSMTNPVIVQYLNTYNQNAQSVARYIESGTMNNPVAAKTIENQRQLQQDLASMTEGYMASLEQRIINERNMANSASIKMRSVPQKQIYLEGMERNQKIKEQLYVSLLTRREELMISQPSLEGSAKVIDAALVNNSPVYPNTQHITFLGFIIGLIIPVAFYLLRRLFDTQVKTYADIEAATTVPFLCEIPALSESDLGKVEKDKDDKKKDKRFKEAINVPDNIIVAGSDREGISESFRHLRAKIEFLSGKQGEAKVLLFTSLMAGSGKTFTTSTTREYC